MTTNKWIVSFVTNRNTQNIIYRVLYRVHAKIMNLNPFNLLKAQILKNSQYTTFEPTLIIFTVEKKVKRRAWAIPAQCRCLLKNKKVKVMLETKIIVKKCEWIKDEENKIIQYNNTCYRLVVGDVFQSKIGLLEINK